MRAVWLSELDENDEDGNVILTGVFDAHAEIGQRFEDASGMTFAEAIDWARGRADHIYVDVEWRRYRLGETEDADIPALPSALAAELAVRRRPERDRWMDRGDDAPSVDWEVEVELSPDSLAREERSAQEAIVERAAARMVGTGFGPASWTAEELDAGLADIARQREAAGRPDQTFWTTTYRLAYLVRATARAATHRTVQAAVRAAVIDELRSATGREPDEWGAEDIRDRWGLDVFVHPPGYAPPPGSFRRNDARGAR